MNKPEKVCALAPVYSGERLIAAAPCSTGSRPEIRPIPLIFSFVDMQNSYFYSIRVAPRESLNEVGRHQWQTNGVCRTGRFCALEASVSGWPHPDAPGRAEDSYG